MQGLVLVLVLALVLAPPRPWKKQTKCSLNQAEVHLLKACLGLCLCLCLGLCLCLVEELN